MGSITAGEMSCPQTILGVTLPITIVGSLRPTVYSIKGNALQDKASGSCHHHAGAPASCSPVAAGPCACTPVYCSICIPVLSGVREECISDSSRLSLRRYQIFFACPHYSATLPHVPRGLSDQAFWKLINVTMAGVLLRLALRQEHVVVPWRCLLRVL